MKLYAESKLWRRRTMKKTLKQRIETLEKRINRDTEFLVLSGPDGGDEEALARWMKETGKPKPKLFVYVRKLAGARNTHFG